MSDFHTGNSVVSYDDLTSVNWLCQKCNIKFGAMPNKNGIVKCKYCGSINSLYSQNQLTQKPNMTDTNLKSKRALTGLRPTGELHLGNYFGAIKQFIELQSQVSESFLFVADLHALTTAVEDKLDLDEASISAVRWYLACGVDPSKAVIYRQSDIAELSYLHLLLSMIAPVGELERCVTYKDKVQDLTGKKKLVSLGLLSYPALMSADILFANVDIVPVGKDQEQHLEITREIARRYNYHFSKQIKFTEPKNYNLKSIKVPGLQAGKMSKSVGGTNNVIYLSDDPKTVTKKIKAMKTDLGPQEGQEMSEEMKNVFSIIKLCSSQETYNDFKNKYDNCEQKFYGSLKQQLAVDVNNLLAPIQNRFNNDESCSENYVQQLLSENAQRVKAIAAQTLRAVQQDMGFKKAALQL